MKWKGTFKHCMLKGKYENTIIGMQFVVFFIVWMMTKKLMFMRCLFCYNNLMHVINLNTKERKWFITYYKTYGIIVLKKHADNDHAIIVKKFEEEINALIKGPFERQSTKKEKFQEVKYLSFFVKDLLKNDDEQHNDFFTKSWFFSCEKSIAIAVCEKCLVQMFNFTFMSLSCLSF